MGEREYAMPDGFQPSLWESLRRPAAQLRAFDATVPTPHRLPVCAWLGLTLIAWTRPLMRFCAPRLPPRCPRTPLSALLKRRRRS